MRSKLLEVHNKMRSFKFEASGGLAALSYLLWLRFVLDATVKLGERILRFIG